MLVRHAITGLSVCAECAAGVILLVYEAGGRLPTLQEGLVRLFGISQEAEAEILAEQREELARRYQARLMSLREPSVSDEQAEMLVTMTGHMREKIRALAQEAGVSSSAWVRQAILLAFEETGRKA